MNKKKPLFKLSSPMVLPQCCCSEFFLFSASEINLHETSVWAVGETSALLDHISIFQLLPLPRFSSTQWCVLVSFIWIFMVKHHVDTVTESCNSSKSENKYLVLTACPMWESVSFLDRHDSEDIFGFSTVGYLKTSPSATGNEKGHFIKQHLRIFRLMRYQSINQSLTN